MAQAPAEGRWAGAEVATCFQIMINLRLSSLHPDNHRHLQARRGTRQMGSPTVDPSVSLCSVMAKQMAELHLQPPAGLGDGLGHDGAGSISSFLRMHWLFGQRMKKLGTPPYPARSSVHQPDAHPAFPSLLCLPTSAPEDTGSHPGGDTLRTQPTGTRLQVLEKAGVRMVEGY